MDASQGDALRVDLSLRTEADEILWGMGLHSLLQEYGQVQVTGSYALKLMAWRDLDIYLVTERLSLSAFFELGGRIAEWLGPARIHFRNERIARTDGLPGGLYFGIYLGSGGERTWKIDLWCITPQQYQELRAYHEGIASRLTDPLRLNILAIKSQCWMKPGYRRTYSSGDIYRAVLEEGVQDLAGFDAYLRRTRGCGVEDG
jgi:hypothetical protein